MALEEASTSLISGTAAGAAAGSLAGPIGTAVGAAVGFGLSAFGAYESFEGSKKRNQAVIAQIQLEQQEEAERQKATELQYNRMSTENYRNALRAGATSLASAVNQGAQFSSSAKAGQAQVSSEYGFNQLGLNQNIEIARNMFRLNAQISQQKIAAAQAGQQVELGSGLSSLGGQFTAGATTLGRLTSGFGSSNKPSYTPQPTGGIY